MQTIVHVLSLDGIGGTERNFSSFISHSSVQNKFKHSLVSSKLHEFLRNSVISSVDRYDNYKRFGAIQIPKFGNFRSCNIRRIVADHDPDIVMFWNHMDYEGTPLKLRSIGVRTLYFERGMAWRQSRKRHYVQFFKQIDTFLANSFSGKRMLQLRWGVTQPIHVILNALRDEVSPREVQVKQLPTDRPFRLGFAGRFTSFKGVFLALAVAKTLLDQGVDLELHIAGEGALKENLIAEIRKKGLSEKVFLAGLVKDMRQFYQHVDALIIPSIREPFGTVNIEAQAWGCPVIAAGVDGLPETILEGETGYLVAPELPLCEYAHMGGDLRQMPEVVYTPHDDRVGPPLLADPSRLAEAVLQTMSSSEHYSKLSLKASTHVLSTYRYEAHINDLLQILSEV